MKLFSIWGWGWVAWFCLLQPALAYYHPSAGRWLNRDPLAEADGPALMTFAANAPTSAVDEDGRGTRNAPPLRISAPGRVTYPGWNHALPWEPSLRRQSENRIGFTAAVSLAGSACSVVFGGALWLSPEPTTATKFAGAYMIGAGLDGLYVSLTGRPGVRETSLEATGLPHHYAVVAVLATDLAICGKCCPGGKAVPRGFDNAEQFQQAVAELEMALLKSGITDAQIGVRGSAVTGVSFRTGQPFRTGSDIDFFVESGLLTEGVHSSRNIPGFVHPHRIARDCDPIAEWAEIWSETLNRKITVGGFQPGTVPPGPVLRP